LRARSWKLLLRIGDSPVVEVFVHSCAIHTQVAPFYALYFLQFPSGVYCLQLNTRTWYLWRNVSEVMTLRVFPSWWLVPTFPEPWQRSSIHFCNRCILIEIMAFSCSHFMICSKAYGNYLRNLITCNY
jgi:hypothetical protein